MGFVHNTIFNQFRYADPNRRFACNELLGRQALDALFKVEASRLRLLLQSRTL